MSFCLGQQGLNLMCCNYTLLRLKANEIHYAMVPSESNLSQGLSNPNINAPLCRSSIGIRKLEHLRGGLGCDDVEQARYHECALMRGPIVEAMHHTLIVYLECCRNAVVVHDIPLS